MPERFGRYELLEIIGRGGMGEVYRAHDTERERIVALKLLPTHLASDESFKARFRRESRLAARLNDPHIIPIHDFGEIDGSLYIDMRLVEGRDLGSIVETDGPLPPATAVNIISQVASALDAAHRNGLIHRDVKPSNILIAEDDEQDEAEPFAYLVDFGIARPVAQDGTALTATAGTIGTVAYMSPERIAGQIGDKSTDIYALGCVLYEAITGHKPFGGEPFAIMYAHLHAPPPQVSAAVPGVPVALDEAVARAMAKDPADRQPSAGTFAAQARRALQREQPSPEATTRRTPPPVPVTPGPQPPDVGAARPAGADESLRHAPPAPAAPLTPQPFPPLAPPFIQPSVRPRRRGLIYGTTAVALAAGAVIALVLAPGNGTSGHGTGASSSQHPSSSPPASGSPTSFNTGGASAKAVDWAHFASFSKLVGTRDNDTAHAFRRATCVVKARSSGDPAGLLDLVRCNFSGSLAALSVSRYSSAAPFHTYLNILTDADRFTVSPIAIAGRTVGLVYVAVTSASYVDYVTYFCGLPNYMIQYFAEHKTEVPASELRDQFWAASTFPDPVPPPCNSDLSGPAPGSTPLTRTGLTDKSLVSVDVNALAAYLNRGDTIRSTVAVQTPSGSELMVVTQRGKLEFWTWLASAHTLQLTGTSTYPYAPGSLGAPSAKGTGALLSGMDHATFVITGTFTTDGSGNAIAYTRGAGHWGAVKASGTRLVPSSAGSTANAPVGQHAAAGFVGGLLETADCSQLVPVSQCGASGNRVLVYWRWHSDGFDFDHRAGAAR